MQNNIDDKQDMVRSEEDLRYDNREILKAVSTLPSMEVINCILAQDDPERVVKEMSRVDLFWLVKKVGEEDSAPLLQLASEEQWQYLLDMELWKNDRIDIQKTFAWFERLFNADEKKFMEWLFREGHLYSHNYFYKILRVFVQKDDDQEFPKDFFTLDSTYYVKILDEEHKEEIEKILRAMAKTDFNKYQALLLGIMGSIPAEMEEELFRLRGVRLAEDGYLPFDEAIEVYSHQNLDKLKKNESEYKIFSPIDDETKALIPIAPLVYAQGQNMITDIIGRIDDPVLMDRFRLEFGGLCNQIISADGIIPDEIELLKDVCMKSAGYINLGLEKLSGGDLNKAEECVRNNPLISLFRAGFSLALELKWEAEKWMNHAWYSSFGLETSFWGDEWGGILAGITLNKPRLFIDLEEDREFKDFATLSEIEKGRVILHRLIVLDRLLELISSNQDLEGDRIIDQHSTFQPLIFTYWFRELLGLEPGIRVIPINEAERIFLQLREGDINPPFQMPGYQDVFIKDLVVKVPDLKTDDAHLLKESLAIIWQQFVEEYALVEIDDLDVRFAKFLFIRNG